MLDFSQDPRYLAWASKILCWEIPPPEAKWLTSLSKDGKILGVVVYSRFTPGSCEITVASESPTFITKRFAFAVAYYPFVQLNCHRVTAFVRVGNAKSLNLAQQLGFQIEGTVRKWFPDSDAYILGLLREDCNWLKDDYGIRRQRSRNT
jgi:RimJ/RimL family protein N-acetyltransferase